jgi:AcrR family transcriptional regulator
MIQSAMLLIGEHGVEATSFPQILEHAGAARGSIYHHFPRGKAQVVEEAVRWAGDLIATGLAAALEKEDPIAAVDGVADFWRAALSETNYAVGCPVVAATVDGGRVPGARQAAREAFARWAELQAAILQRAGVPEQRARAIGTLLVAAIEGAVVVARAESSMEPFERVIDELHALLREAVAAGAD